MNGSLLGPSFDNDQVEKTLASLGAKFIKRNEEELLEIVTDKLVENKTIGWFQEKWNLGLER